MARINWRISDEKNKILQEYSKKYSLPVSEILDHAIMRLLERDTISDEELRKKVEHIKEKDKIKDAIKNEKLNTQKTRLMHLPNNTMRRISNAAYQSLLKFGYVDQDEIKLIITGTKEQYEMLPSNIQRAIKTKMQKIYLRCKSQEGIEEMIGQHKTIERVKKQIANRYRTE